MFDDSLDCRAIDIDANDFHVGREHAHDRERMTDRRQQQHMRHVGELFTHHFLGLRSRPSLRRESIPRPESAPIEDDIDIVANAGVHDPAGQDIFLNSCCNAADLPNCIDRAHEILVSAARERQVKANAQRGAEQRPFHVVTGKRISGEKPIEHIRLQ